MNLKQKIIISNFTATSYLPTITCTLFLFLINLFFIACSSQQAAFDHRAELPLWVTSPYQVCEEKLDLCASSEGNSLKGSDQAAKAEMAAFFRSEIKRNFSEKTFNKSQTDQQTVHQTLGTASGTNTELTNENTQEQYLNQYQDVLSFSIDTVLEACQITERYIGNDRNYYSLAKISKRQFSDLLMKKIQQLEDEKDQLLRDHPGRLTVTPLKDILVKRQSLLLLSELVTSSAEQSSSSAIREHVDNWWKNIMQDLPAKKKVFLSFSDEKIENIDFEKDLKDFLIHQFTEVGHVNVSNKSQATNSIKVNVELSPENIQVEGFLKGRVHLQIIAFDLAKGSETSGSMDEIIDITARSREQLWHKVQTQLRERIESNIYKLNL